MKSIGRGRLLRAWILLLTLCVIAVIAADIFLPAQRQGTETGDGKTLFIDSPVELMPADASPVEGPDSIDNKLINIINRPEYEGQQTKA